MYGNSNLVNINSMAVTDRIHLNEGQQESRNQFFNI